MSLGQTQVRCSSASRLRTEKRLFTITWAPKAAWAGKKADGGRSSVTKSRAARGKLPRVGECHLFSSWVVEGGEVRLQLTASNVLLLAFVAMVPAPARSPHCKKPARKNSEDGHQAGRVWLGLS